MANKKRDQVNQSPPVVSAPRTNVAQSPVNRAARLNTPAGVRRESVNQKPEDK